MSETHESGCFPCGWWKKKENKADVVGRSISSKQVQESNDEQVRTAGSTIPAQATNTTEICSSSPSDLEVKLAKDKGVPTNMHYTSEPPKQASSAPESSIAKVETARTTEQANTVNATSTDDHLLCSSEGGKPANDWGVPANTEYAIKATKEALAAPGSINEKVETVGTSKQSTPDEHGPEAHLEKDVPTDMEYAMEATKKALTVLKGIADIAKFPLVKEVVELGISILDTCQTISDVQSGAHRLRNRITCLLLSVADSTKEAEESDRLVKDLENLKGCLATIMNRLKLIASQNAFKSSYLSAPNMKIISDCEKDFEDSMERFEILRSLEMGQGIGLIQRQLATFYGVSQGMAGNVEHIKHEVDDIKSILIGMRTSDTTSTTIRLPRLTSQLFGRKEVIQRIAEDLSSLDPERSRICILAPGGMGKTSTALAVLHHGLTKATFGEDRHWIPCIQANSIDNFIAILSRHIRAENRTGNPLEDIMATLQNGNRRRVILLDNFETPWRGIPEGESELGPILEDLDSIPHISILVTMRSEWAPLEAWRCEYLGPIKSADSIGLYTSIHLDSRKYPEQLKELLDELGHMPYAITLMASRGKRSNANPGKLLKEWRAQGTDMLSRTSEGINRCIELSVKSSYVQDCEDAMRILQILSLLPAGVDAEDLSIWAGEWPSQAIETLRNAALIITQHLPSGKDGTKDHYFVLPVVQSYMAKKDRIPLGVRKGVMESCYQFLAQSNSSFTGPNVPLFSAHLVAIASQEANLQALLTDTLNEQHPLAATPLSPSNHLDALLSYISYQKWARPRPEIAEQVVALAQKVGALQQKAATLFCLGDILRRLTRYKEARQVLECAHKTFDCVGDDLMVLRSQLLQIEVDIFWGVPSGEIWNSFNTIQASWQTASSINPTFNAFISYYRGFLLWYERKDGEAIPVLEQAADSFGGLGIFYEQADSLYLVARSHARLQNFSAALQNIDSSIRLLVYVFGEGFKTPALVSALLVRARCLKGLDCWDDEIEPTLAAALEASRQLGLSMPAPQILFELGEVYIRKGELPAARDVYEEVIRKGDGIDDNTSSNAVAGAKHNLKHIEYLYAKRQGSDETDFVSFSQPERY